VGAPDSASAVVSQPDRASEPQADRRVGGLVEARAAAWSSASGLGEAAQPVAEPVRSVGNVDAGGGRLAGVADRGPQGARRAAARPGSSVPGPAGAPLVVDRRGWPSATGYRHRRGGRPGAGRATSVASPSGCAPSGTALAPLNRRTCTLAPVSASALAGERSRFACKVAPGGDRRVTHQLAKQVDAHPWPGGASPVVYLCRSADLDAFRNARYSAGALSEDRALCYVSVLSTGLRDESSVVRGRVGCGCRGLTW